MASSKWVLIFNEKTRSQNLVWMVILRRREADGSPSPLGFHTGLPPALSGWRVAHRWSPSHMDTKFDQVWSGWFTFQIGATSLASWKQAFLYVIIVWNPSAFPSYRNANKSQNKRLCDHNIPHCRDLSKFQANGFGQFIYLPQSTDRQADQNKEWNSGTSSTCSKKGCWMSGMLLDGFKPLSGWWWMVFSNSVLLQLIVERIYEAIHN